MAIADKAAAKRSEEQCKCPTEDKIKTHAKWARASVDISVSELGKFSEIHTCSKFCILRTKMKRNTRFECGFVLHSLGIRNDSPLQMLFRSIAAREKKNIVIKIRSSEGNGNEHRLLP